MRPEWAEANRDTVSRLIVALDRAARWSDEPGNRGRLAEVLAEERHVAAPADIIRRVLAGEFAIDPERNRRVVENYLVFHADFANFPRPSQALWTYSQMVRWGQTSLSRQGIGAAISAYRPDLYREALGKDALPADANGRLEGATDGDRFMDGHVFDPGRIDDYIRSFTVGGKGGVQHPGNDI
jgi:NitT/TauT family transport system ATP-binding protein